MDTLSLLLTRFRISAGVFYTGRICGVHPFAADQTRAHLHLIEQGPVDLVDAEGHCTRFAQPTVLFLPRPEQHRIIADDEAGARVLCATVQFGGHGTHNPLGNSLPALVAVEVAQLQDASSLLALIHQETCEARSGAQAAIDCLCELLIVRLLRHCLDHGLTAGGTLAGLADPRLAKAIVAIHHEPNRAWTLADMAAQAGMSRARFAGRFRDVTGQTPAHYLAGWRIAVAQSLLKTGRPMKQVCLEAGYASSSALTRAFIRQVGISPVRWRKSTLGPAAETLSEIAITRR